MGMVGFVMKGAVPFQMFHRYLKIFSERLSLCAEHIPPPFTGVISKPLCIFTAKRYDDRPHIAFINIQFI